MFWLVEWFAETAFKVCWRLTVSFCKSKNCFSISLFWIYWVCSSFCRYPTSFDVCSSLYFSNWSFTSIRISRSFLHSWKYKSLSTSICCFSLSMPSIFFDCFCSNWAISSSYFLRVDLSLIIYALFLNSNSFSWPLATPLSLLDLRFVVELGLFLKTF